MEIGTYYIFCPHPLFEGHFTSAPHNIEGFWGAELVIQDLAGEAQKSRLTER